MLDTKFTHGQYWNGSQISYWLFLFITIFPLTGILGIDHFLLRSPLTGTLKILTLVIAPLITQVLMLVIPQSLAFLLVPLAFSWYFYDIAQVCSQSELIKKYGIGVPYFGPQGIGAGIFTGNPKINESPKNVQRPWLFILYVLTTLISFTFPLNKFVIGDYEAGFFYLLCAILIIGLPLVIAQGIYDIFNLLFDTDTIFQTGFARIPGVAVFLKDYYTYTALGPNKACSDNCDPSQLNKVFVTATAPLQVGLQGAKAATAAATVAVTGAKIATKIAETGASVVEAAGPQIEATAKAAAEVATKTAGAAAEGTNKILVNNVPGYNPDRPINENLAGVGAEKVTEGILIASNSTMSAARATGEVAGATGNIAKTAADKYRASLPQTGGGLDLISMTPSVPFLLVSVGLLAFSGYVFFIYKNTLKKSEKSDDPPRNPRTVRGPPKSDQ